MAEPIPALIRAVRPGDARPIAEAHVQSWQATYRGLLPDSYLQGLADNLQRRVDFIDNAVRNGSRPSPATTTSSRLLVPCRPTMRSPQ